MINYIPLFHVITILHNTANQRIDNFIRSKIYKISKNTLYKIIRIGIIKINKKKVQPNYKLKIGDILYIPNYLIKKYNQKNITLDEKIKNKILSSIIYEDKYLLIINKPTGIAVHGGSGLKFGIIESLRLLKPNIKYLELVHRLDRHTSGILILAKKKSALKYLHEQFRNQIIIKKYIALIHGNLSKKKEIVQQPLIKNKYHKKKIVQIHNQGKKSKTIFILKKNFISYAMVSIYPKTGRTHQIRVHASYIGHPIIFDHDYGNKFLDLKINPNYQIQNMLLHASKIIFYHPQSHQKTCIYVPLGKRFKKYLQIK
ncbi:RluA family pseudouridine synthase [Buchnera aphidicola]|uniref:Pseudouridine synthase n=1 Tax=Buchnera aphidicola (Stegophylla sp.) TaxID=2315800 RepID=A0A4D6Y9K0_9GAMM|nr:RluA family pseudouridine synthase [Buchnera aphidicola (Stegophylla sp.)]QCI26387.1 RluA family pseudouridine synthase [Buchnera aphidicola (Stegophylla sp.)]